MAEPTPSDSSPDTDRDFDPSADMLVHDYDDEHTLDDEEALSNAESAGNELDNLEKEGEMPIEDLLAMYYGGQTGPPPAAIEPNDTRSSSMSSEEEILSNQDLTLDKDIIARDLLKNEDNDNETTVNDLLDSVEMPSQTMRLLRSSSQPGSSDDESEDLDYEPQPDDDWKKSIQVGSDYQAVIPQGLCKYGDAPAYENEDRLLWDPFRLDDPEVEGYLKEVQTQSQQASHGVTSLPQGPHARDDEQALYLLLQCGHNVEEALRRRKMQTVLPTDPMSLWSEEECRNFENGLRQYGKDFYLIQQNKVKTRSVGELVQFYYLWKKTERHDVFANKTRLEKKKYALHPGVTDYMDRFLDEQENPAPPRDRSSSPNINSLLYGDPKRHLDHYKEHSADLDAALDMVQKVVDTNALALSPLKLHHAEINAAASGGPTDVSNHGNATSSVHGKSSPTEHVSSFPPLGFRPIATGDLSGSVADPLVTSQAMTCIGTKSMFPLVHSAAEASSTETPNASKPESPASGPSKSDNNTSAHPRLIGSPNSCQPVNKRLKTQHHSEWTVNNATSECSSVAPKPSNDFPQSPKTHSDTVSGSKSTLPSLCKDNTRIISNDYRSMGDGLLSKSSPHLNTDSDKLASVTIGLSSVVSGALKSSEYSAVSSTRESGPPRVPTPQTAEPVLQ